ncbi:MAG: HAMP domain-containing histidine kinase [Prolixibacteraceae bacterium]|nr:HAMP domain-containing histidine kinase [Prolixibacteraceae bacterium]
MYKLYLLILMLFCLLDVFASSKDTSESVLLINSYHVGYHWSDEVTNGVIEFFSENPDVFFYTEYLDSKRFPEQNQLDEFFQNLNTKYNDIALDAIIVSDNDALNFVLDKRNESFFENVPLIACGIGNAEYYKQFDNLFIIVEEILYRYDIDLITKLLPDIKEVFFITDHSTTGEIYRNDIKEIFVEKYPQIKLTVPDCINLDELIVQLRKIRYPTVVYYAGVTVDCNNQSVSDTHAADLVSSNTSAPLFSGYYSSVVQSYVGGYTSNGKYHGRAAAKITYDLLNGDISNISSVQNIERVPVFDYSLLQKYGAKIDQLPENTIFRNRPENFWVKNKKVLIISAMIILNLLMIIGALYRSFKIEKKYRKQLQVEMEKASLSNKVKTIFVENMSHEMRTPLNSIVGFSDLLLDSMPDGQDKDFVRIISENSLALNNIISQIFDFSLLKSHRVELYITNFDLFVLIDEIFADQKNLSLIESKNLSVSKNFNINMLPIIGDKEKVYQVMKHLIGNALNFTPNGEVEIMVRYSVSNNPVFTKEITDQSDARFVVVGIFDSGIGISAKYLTQLFEPFTHDNEDDTNANRGLGLGLSISKLIIEIMGGQIKVESVVNKGTKVVFTLPVELNQ